MHTNNWAVQVAGFMRGVVGEREKKKGEVSGREKREDEGNKI